MEWMPIFPLMGPSEIATEPRFAFIGRRRTTMNTIIPLGADEIDAARRAIRREISQRFEEQRRRASVWQRAVLWLKVEIEVRAELKRRFPHHVLRVRSS